MGFEVLEHTADVGLHVWGTDLPEMLAEAGRALLDVMGTVDQPPRLVAHVELEAADVEALVERWLSELLYLLEVRRLAAVDFDVKVCDQPWRLQAEVRGAPADALVQHGPAVKAVTYHRLRVDNTEGGCEAWVYLDV